MPVRVPLGRILSNPIQTRLKASISTSESLPSAGPRARVDTVIPSYYNSRARTLVLCFDGTGDQFNANVHAYMLSLSARVPLADSVPFRIPIS